MTCVLVLMLLTAGATAKAPPPVATAILSPAPPAAFVRIQPRRVTASSYLQNGWNQFEQNYLPPYVADDDPATAWVEGVAGTGEGEHLDWHGPTLDGPHVFKVFVRNGFQKSTRLYLANARPRRVRIEPLALQGDRVAATPSSRAVEQELADAVGWQEIDVPTSGAVSSLRLTVLSVNAGTSYTDTCISDLRVYVDAGDKYRADVEKAFAEEVRKFAAERQAAAKAGAAKAHVELLPSYGRTAPVAEATLATDASVSRTPSRLLAEMAPRLSGFSPAKTTALPRAIALLEVYDTLTPVAPGAVPDGWRRARLNALVGRRSTEVALQPVQDLHPTDTNAFAQLAPYFHRKDFAAFEATDEAQRAARKALEAWTVDTSINAPAGAPDFARKCMAACKAILSPGWQPIMASWWEPGVSMTLDDWCRFECPTDMGGPEGETADVLRAVANSATFVRGDFASPTALYRDLDDLVGERDVFHDRHRILVTYDGDVASAVLTVERGDGSDRDLTPLVVAYILDWTEGSATSRPRLTRVTTFSLKLEGAANTADRTLALQVASFGAPAS